MWGGGIKSDVNESLIRLNNSLPTDQRLWQEDLDGSIAYAEALFDVKIITLEELGIIKSGLETVRQKWHERQVAFLPSDEDVHTVNERLLTEIVGPVGGKLHTGRSRNDQVALDVKLWLRKAAKRVMVLLIACVDVMKRTASAQIDVLMPGYTHLQRAQAIRYSHWLLSHAFSLKADVQKFESLVVDMDESMPLGSGALAGNPFGIDRVGLAARLGFTHCTPNSMQAVGNRDNTADFLYFAALTSTHLSRVAEDLILFSTKEFGFISLAQSMTTGSSLMPQKRNPDSLELIRGVAGMLLGKVPGFLATLKGTPSTYNKDLQFDKKELFEAFDLLESSLSVLVDVIGSMKANETRMKEALSPEMLATDMAYYLVRRGVPFREAHHAVSEVVELARKLGCEINKVPLAQLREINTHFHEDLSQIWNFEASVEQYSVVGGTSKSSVLQQIKVLEQFCEKFSPEPK